MRQTPGQPWRVVLREAPPANIRWWMKAPYLLLINEPSCAFIPMSDDFRPRPDARHELPRIYAAFPMSKVTGA